MDIDKELTNIDKSLNKAFKDNLNILHYKESWSIWQYDSNAHKSIHIKEIGTLNYVWDNLRPLELNNQDNNIVYMVVKNWRDKKQYKICYIGGK